MSEQSFWEIVDAASRSGVGREYIEERLQAMDAEGIVSFENNLSKQLALAYTFPLLEANFIIEGFVSDEGFLNFRAWLVSQGKKRFMNAVEDPETIADWLEKDGVAAIDGGELLDVARNVFVEEFESDEGFDRNLRIQMPQEFRQDWPENKAVFKAKWPRLFQKFWDDDKIQEFHQE